MKKNKILFFIFIGFAYQSDLRAETGIKKFFQWLFTKTKQPEKNRTRVELSEEKKNEEEKSESFVSSDVVNPEKNKGASAVESASDAVAVQESEKIVIVENSFVPENFQEKEIFSEDSSVRDESDSFQDSTQYSFPDEQKWTEISEEEIGETLELLWHGVEPSDEHKEHFLLVLESVSREELGPQRILRCTRNSVKTQYMRISRKWQAESITDKDFVKKVQELLRVVYLKAVS